MATILLIDDESLLVTLSAWLNAAGHTVATASDGLEGARRFRDKSADVVLMDMVMPLSGLMTIRVLRSQFPALKIIAMTGGGSHRLVYARDLGAQRTLTKPFPPEQLTEAIADVVYASDVPPR